MSGSSDSVSITGLRDIEAMEQVPLAERLSCSTTLEAIGQGAARNPEAIALSFLMNGDLWDQPMQVTYKELLASIHRCANMFHDLGIGPQGVVTFLLPNIPQTHYVLWGAEATGIVNPINPLLEPETIREICVAAGTRIIVTLGDLPGTEIFGKVMAIKDRIPTLERVLCVMGATDEKERVYAFEELEAAYPGDRLTFTRDRRADTVSSLYHTGGTTGTPKLARRTDSNEVAMAWAIRAMGDMRPGDTVLCGLPLFHVNGTMVTGLAPFSVGGHVVLLSPMGYRDPGIIKNFYRIVEKYRANYFSAVPTVLSTLLEIPLDGADISSLRYAICGAAPLSVEVFKKFETHTGMKILEGYGLTEGTTASAINPKDGRRKVGSIGMRMPYQQMKVAVTDEGGRYLRDAEPDEIGVIAIAGPTVFRGYVEEAHNQGIWLEDGWFNTGDLGRQDADGYFWLTGRKKELIIRGGHNIDPGTIEDAFYKVPEVQVAAAVGRPDAHAGEVPVVYVQLAEGCRLEPAELLARATEHVGERAAIPKAVHILDEIPLTPVGKIFKPALRWELIARTYREVIGDAGAAIEVLAREDKLHGTSVDIRVTDSGGQAQGSVEALIRKRLALYTVPFSIRFDI